jgi:DNA-binding response OmpR family regulator
LKKSSWARAVDHTKPISPPVLMARVQSHLSAAATLQRLLSLSRKPSRYLAPQVFTSHCSAHPAG